MNFSHVNTSTVIYNQAQADAAEALAVSIKSYDGATPDQHKLLAILLLFLLFVFAACGVRCVRRNKLKAFQNDSPLWAKTLQPRQSGYPEDDPVLTSGTWVVRGFFCIFSDSFG